MANLDKILDRLPVEHRLIQSLVPGDRESVRTSFTISRLAIESKEWMAEQLGTSQKHVVDKTCEILESVDEGDLVKALADYLNDRDQKDITRKTHVISRWAQASLQSIAKASSAARDAVLEYGLILSRALCERQMEELRKTHEEVRGIMSDFLNVASNTEDKIIELLGTDDPIRHRFGNVMVLAENLNMAIKDQLEKGVPVDPDEM